MAALRASAWLVFLQPDFALSPVAGRWLTHLHSVYNPSAKGAVLAAVSLSSVRGLPLPVPPSPAAVAAVQAAQDCADQAVPTGGGPAATEGGVCAAPFDATVVLSGALSLSAFAAAPLAWGAFLATLPTGTPQSALGPAFTAFCNGSSKRALHLNLGTRLTLAAPVGPSAATLQLVQWWHPEMTALPVTPLDMLSVEGDLAGLQAAAIEASDKQLMRVLGWVPEHASVPFPGIMFINGGFVEMTLSWVCNVQSMPGVLERSVVLCTDVQCLDGLRGSALARRLGAVVGVSLMARIHRLLSSRNMKPLDATGAKSQGYDTNYFQLFMLVRQFMLRDIVQAGLPYLLEEPDAWWTRDAYAYFDGVLASGGEVNETKHRRVPPASIDVPALVAQNELDVVFYLDAPKRKFGVGGGLFLALPTENSKAFFGEWSNRMMRIVARQAKIGKWGASANEQEMLQKLLAEAWGGLKYVFLPQRQFPNGGFYMGRRPGKTFHAALQQQRVIMLQMNYLPNLQRKVARAKQFGHWCLQGSDGQQSCKPAEELHLLPAPVEGAAGR